MGFKNKIFVRTVLLLALLIMLCTSSMMYFVLRQNREQWNDHVSSQAMFLAEQSVNELLWDDRVALHNLFHNLVSANSYILYAFIERNGRPYLHTFETGVPRQLMLPTDYSLSGVNKRTLKNEHGGVFYDISAPMGPKGAVLHIGMSRSIVDGYIRNTLWTIALISIGFFGLMLYPAWVVSTSITREVGQLTHSLRELNQELEKRVAERTEELTIANRELEGEITHRKDIEKALRESEEMLRVFINSIPHRAWLKDREGRLVAVNEPYLEACGLVEEQVCGRTDADIWGAGPAGKYMESDRKVSESRRQVRETEVQVDKNGSKKWFETIRTPNFDDSGEIIGITGVSSDITERVLVEKQREDFYQMITHDIKSPLSVILGYSDLLCANSKTRIQPDLMDMLTEVQRNSKKLLFLVNNFLDFSKIRDRDINITKAPTNTAELASQVGKSTSIIAEQKGILFDVNIEDGLPVAMLDRDYTERALSNLLQNAVNYTPSGGAVRLDVSGTEAGGRKHIAFTVSDTGPGIPDDTRDKIFEMHYRLAANNGTKGHGLGLSIVKAVANAHGGYVELESELGKGSIFRLVLPVE